MPFAEKVLKMLGMYHGMSLLNLYYYALTYYDLRVCIRSDRYCGSRVEVP
jgi:hypothetical protein